MNQQTCFVLKFHMSFCQIPAGTVIGIYLLRPELPHEILSRKVDAKTFRILLALGMHYTASNRAQLMDVIFLTHRDNMSVK